MRDTTFPVTALILAGGLARRMGNVDKGLLPLHGKPLVQWAVERLAPQAEEILINANRNLEQYQGYGCRVISDALPDYAGPLAGLQRGLMEARYDLLATAPCDSPLLPLDLVPRLYAALQEHQADLAVVQASGRLQPVFCLCRKTLLPQLNRFLAQGGRKIEAWHAGLNLIAVPFENALAFCNLNTAADLQQLERSLAGCI